MARHDPNNPNCQYSDSIASSPDADFCTCPSRKDEKLDAAVVGARMGIDMAIALARRGALSLSPGPTDDPTKYPYNLPLHPRAEAYIASQREEWPNIPDREVEPDKCSKCGQNWYTCFCSHDS